MLVDTTGNLFANAHQAQAFAHGINCQGEMGVGIALESRTSYPALYAAYHRRCLAQPRELNPGDCWLWIEPEKPAVFNLASQEFYGRRGRATLPWLRQALDRMRLSADQNGISTIAMPHVGSGLGGLALADVRAAIAVAFADWSGTVYLYAPHQV